MPNFHANDTVYYDTPGATYCASIVRAHRDGTCTIAPFSEADRLGDPFGTTNGFGNALRVESDRLMTKVDLLHRNFATN